MPYKIHPQGIAVSEIAALLGSVVIGDMQVKIFTICPLDQPSIGAISFTNKKNPKSISYQVGKLVGKLGCVLIPKIGGAISLPAGIAVIPVEDPLQALLKLMPLFFEPYLAPEGISPKASVDPTAKIGSGVKIGACTVIGAGVEIGSNVTIHPNVTIYAGARVGDGSIIHSGAVIREECEIGRFNVIQNGAVIGADGFGYIPDPTLGLKGVPQIGRVILEDYVEVGANSCVDRATLGVTQIGKGSKLDNLVQVGHNVRIGSHTIICGQVGIAGSTEIGSRVVIGGDAGLAGHISIADDVRIAGKSGVTNSIESAGDYAGFPAVEARRWRKQLAALNRLVRRSAKGEKARKLDADE